MTWFDYKAYQEQVRKEDRSKWIRQIQASGETSAGDLKPVYNSVFQSFYNDADAYGQGKVVSAYVALLEKNYKAPHRGDHLLRYVAATMDHANKILDKTLFKDMQGISFASIECGKPIHVPRVTIHGNIHFWDPEKQNEQYEGSFIVVPIKDRSERVFGILGIDTLNDPYPPSVFKKHEIQYFQAVSRALSYAYYQADTRKKTMIIAERTISRIHRFIDSVQGIDIYLVEPNSTTENYVLRKMMVSDEKGTVQVNAKPDKLIRKHRMHNCYLFTCVDDCKSVTEDMYGLRHVTIPLRDIEGNALFVVDINIGEKKELPKADSVELLRTLKLIQFAHREISRDLKHKTIVLEGEQNVDEDTRTEILFDRLLLTDVRHNMSKLDEQVYMEIKNYSKPSSAVKQIFKATLAVFYTNMALEGDFAIWDTCKKFLNQCLTNQIVTFDPTSTIADDVPIELINSYLEEVPCNTVINLDSMLVRLLYDYVSACVSLIQHTRKVTAKRKQLLDNKEDSELHEPIESQKKMDHMSSSEDKLAETITQCTDDST